MNANPSLRILKVTSAGAASTTGSNLTGSSRFSGLRGSKPVRLFLPRTPCCAAFPITVLHCFPRTYPGSGRPGAIQHLLEAHCRYRSLEIAPQRPRTKLRTRQQAPHLSHLCGFHQSQGGPPAATARVPCLSDRSRGALR